MSIKDYDIKFKHVPRKWGNEVRFSAVHKVTGKTINEIVMVEKPDDKLALVAIASYIDSVESFVPVEVEKTYTETEVESILDRKITLAELKAVK